MRAPAVPGPRYRDAVSLLALPIVALLAQDPTPRTLGHADGIKIGEVTASSAVLWTRLTAHEEALDRLDDWDPTRPHWLVPGAIGEVRFSIWPAATPDDRRHTPWTTVGPPTDSCHQQRVDGLQPATRYELRAEGRSGDLRSSFGPESRCRPVAMTT